MSEIELSSLPDVEAFAKAMETDSKSDHEDDDSKDKDDERWVWISTG